MAFSLREIRDDDLELIMNWRMDPDITKFMSTNPKLTLEGQRTWLASLAGNVSVMYWVVLVDEKPVGLINLADMDWENKTMSWGYYIGEKSARSLALAVSLEMSMYKYIFEVLNFNQLNSPVFSLNAGVVKLHMACGSEIDHVTVGEIEKEGVKYDMTHLKMTKEKWEIIRVNKKFEVIDFEVQCTGGGRTEAQKRGLTSK